ncbi:MAG: MATE family efflux transporter [Calditrichaeota bacterium]|nr:MAG: MATE family efflux transporter [Calditrichota bacterium]
MKSLNKQILNLAIPNILTSLSIPFLSSVDTALVGHLEGLHYLGAIAIGGMIFNFIYWGFGFLRMGTTGLTAQAFGENNSEEQNLILMRGLLVAILGGLALILLQFPIAELSFFLVDGTEEVEVFARSYFEIRIWAAPATLFSYVVLGWFLGMQNSKIPLFLTIVVNLSNVIFNLIFIKVFDFKSDGVALGTVFAQYLGFFLSFYILIKHYNFSFKLNFEKILDSVALKKFFRLNLDITIRTLSLVFALSFFTAKSAEFGEEVLAVNTILFQLWMILAYGIDGFAYAAESLVGKFIGAKNIENLKQIIIQIFYWGIGLGVLIALVYYFFFEHILSIFTDKNQVIELAKEFMIWTILAPLINGFCFIWDGIYLGATDSKTLRNSMLICTFIVFIPIFYLTKEVLGNNSLWLAMTLFMFARGVTLSIFAKSRFHLWVKV